MNPIPPFMNPPNMHKAPSAQDLAMSHDNLVAMSAIGDVLKFLHEKKIDIFSAYKIFDEHMVGNGEEAARFMQDFLTFVREKQLKEGASPLPK